MPRGSDSSGAMPRAPFQETDQFEKIVKGAVTLRVLREAESGETVVEVCRKHGISQRSFYLWKKKYAGLGLNELRELCQLREENNKLKRLWRTSVSIATSFRRSSQKSSEASHAFATLFGAESGPKARNAFSRLCSVRSFRSCISVRRLLNCRHVGI